MIRGTTSLFKHKMADFCAPGQKKDSYTCYSHNALRKISERYAQKTGKRIPEGELSKKELHSWLETQFAGRCTTEYCWLEQPETRDYEMLYEYFRPEFPNEWKNDIHTWLNTDDIANVMKQYERKFPDFLFFGPVPVDCPIEWECELTHFNPVKSGYKRFGIVFNLDKHNQSGSHWVALWISLPEQKIEYFDSYGIRPPALIRQFMEKVIEQTKKEGYEIVPSYNKHRFQYGGSECGVFSMYFLIEKLHGKDVQNDMPTDELMTKMRKYLYRPNSNMKQEGATIPTQKLPDVKQMGGTKNKNKNKNKTKNKNK